MGRLTTASIKANKAPGRYGDGDGLYLLVKPTGARSWVLRVQADGRRRDIGLGSVDTETKIGRLDQGDVPLLHRRFLSLAEAREKATILRRYAMAAGTRDLLVTICCKPPGFAAMVTVGGLVVSPMLARSKQERH